MSEFDNINSVDDFLAAATGSLGSLPERAAAVHAGVLRKHHEENVRKKQVLYDFACDQMEQNFGLSVEEVEAIEWEDTTLTGQVLFRVDGLSFKASYGGTDESPRLYFMDGESTAGKLCHSLETLGKYLS